MAKLVLKDKVFCTGVEEVTGTFEAEHGMVIFYNQERGIVLPVPFYVPWQLYGTKATLMIRPSTGEYVEDLGKDDIPVSKMKDKHIDLCEGLRELEGVIEQMKIAVVPSALRWIGFLILCVIVFIASFFVFGKGTIPNYALGVLALLVFLRVRSLYKMLNSRRVFDSRGRWVDLDTGASNLNDGQEFPVD